MGTIDRRTFIGGSALAAGALSGRLGDPALGQGAARSARPVIVSSATAFPRPRGRPSSCGPAAVRSTL